MKLSVFYDHILEAAEQTQKTIPEILREVKRVGIDGVEMNLSRLLQNKKVITKEIQQAGLQICSIYEFYQFGERHITKHWKKIIDAAERVGARKVLIVPGFVSEEEAKLIRGEMDMANQTEVMPNQAEVMPMQAEADIQAVMNQNKKIVRMADTLSQIIRYARPRGIQVTLEDFDLNTAPFSTIIQLEWFMKRVDGLRYTLDTGNFAYSNEDVLEGYRRLKQYIVHVHCKDRGKTPGETGELTGINKGLEPCSVGAGYLPVRQIVAKLLRSGYDGYFAIEHFGVSNQLVSMKESAIWLRSIERTLEMR